MEPKSIDEYLDQVFAGRKGISVSDAQEARQELRRHLEALVAAEEIFGSSPDEAVRVAMVKFGAPNVIGRMLERQWKQEANKRTWAKYVARPLVTGVVVVLLYRLFPYQLETLLGATVGGAILGFSQACGNMMLEWKDVYTESTLDLPKPWHQYSLTEFKQVCTDRVEPGKNSYILKNVGRLYENARYPIRKLNLRFFIMKLFCVAVSLLLPVSWRGIILYGVVWSCIEDIVTACLRQLRVTRELAR